MSLFIKAHNQQEYELKKALSTNSSLDGQFVSNLEEEHSITRSTKNLLSTNAAEKEFLKKCLEDYCGSKCSGFGKLKKRQPPPGSRRTPAHHRDLETFQLRTDIHKKDHFINMYRKLKTLFLQERFHKMKWLITSLMC